MILVYTSLNSIQFNVYILSAKSQPTSSQVSVQKHSSTHMDKIVGTARLMKEKPSMLTKITRIVKVIVNKKFIKMNKKEVRHCFLTMLQQN